MVYPVRTPADYPLADLLAAVFGLPRSSGAGYDLGTWIASTHPRLLSSRNRVITALTLTRRLAAGYGDYDPFVIDCRGWLFL